MEALAATARSFAVRPSALLRIEDPVLALSFDLAAAARLLQGTTEQDAGDVNRIEL